MHKIGSKWTPVLPTAYDNSLSYEEQICKMFNKINNIIDSINSNTDILPTNEDGTINWGNDGDFVVSNGVDKLKWVTIKNGSEVKY